MSADLAIRDALARTIHGLQRDPASGQGTAHTVARIEHGLTCVVTEGAWTLTSDVPPSVGGAGSGPSPGVYGRAGIASCVAIGIKMMAAQANHPIDAVSVGLETDYDWRGDFGVDDVPPGFQRFRLSISVDSPADADATERLVASALRLSSWLNTLAHRQVVGAELAIAGDQRRRTLTIASASSDAPGGLADVAPMTDRGARRP
jgi:uncharacterized OsmC-like protein